MTRKFESSETILDMCFWCVHYNDESGYKRFKCADHSVVHVAT